MYYSGKKLWTGTAEVTDVSVDLCNGLEDLAAGLARGAAGLDPSLFGKVWRGVASALDSHVVNAILPNNATHAFGAGGAAQFSRDMQALLLLFRPYTPHPENHFKGYVIILRFKKEKK